MATYDNDLPKEEYIITFLGDGLWTGRLFRVKNIEGLQYATGQTTGTPEFSTVATNSLSGFKDIDVLAPSKSPLKAAYVEMGFKDALKYTVQVKSGSIRYGPDHDVNAAQLFNFMSPYFDTDPVFAMWLVFDWFPSIQAFNNTPFTVTPKVWFRGYKYNIEEISNGQEIARLKMAGRVRTLTLGGNQIT